MKNKEFINICYKFLNRFIIVDKLIEQLDNMDKKNLQKKEISNINEIINNIKEISNKYPNVEDEYVIKRKQTISHLIERIKNIPKDENNEKFLARQLKDLENDYNSEIDSHERWLEVADFLANNQFFNECIDNLDNNEFLDFITQYIQAPYPPKLSQEKFEELVEVGKEKDKREALWRLAFNYENMNINFDSIVDYFIKVKDGYYLAELISAISYSLDIDKLIEKLNDKKLIEDLIKRKKEGQFVLTDEQFKKLESLNI